MTKPASWYTAACASTEKRLKRAANKVNKDPFNRNLQQQFLNVRKEYRKTCKDAEKSSRKHLLDKLLEIEATDPKEFWRTLNKMRQWGKEKPDPSDNIAPDRWSTYFSQLLNTSKTQGMEIENELPFHPEMDGKITMEELKTRLKISRDGKSFGPDKIIMEYVKYAPDNVLKALLAILNVIFTHSKYPCQWTTNYLKTIFKKGDTSDPNNYRGLAIGSCIGKLYSSILLGRLEKFATTYKIIPPQQIGFKRGFRTADHVYLLKTLIDKALRSKGKLYAAFIDFKKAYDTVNRAKLLKKLQEIGLSGTFLRNIKALYAKTDYKIKLKNRVLDAISSNLGLKQGCPLSPILFNIYISDLDKYLTDNKLSNPSLHDTVVSHFLYADDLVIVATSKEGLQEKLDGLSKFAKEKDLTVNNKKSQIIIFNKTGRKFKENFTLDSARLDVVQTYTYLGIEMNSCGSFTLAIKELTSKARKAMIPLYKTIAQFRIPFIKGLKLFRTYIEPILLYNIENLACFTIKAIEKCKKDAAQIQDVVMKAPTTITQLKFHKYILGIGKQSPNMAVLGEVSDHPLQHKAHLMLLKYWDRIREMEEDTLVKKAYHENIAHNTPWCQSIQLLNASLNLNNTNPTGIEFEKMARTNIKDSFTEYWNQEVNKQPPRLQFYAQVKTEFRREKYVETLPFRDRQRISKLLCSNHHLEVEKGRHNNIERGNRLCKMCSMGAIEDEKHFLDVCPAYEELRTKIIPPGSGNISTQIVSQDPVMIAEYVRAAEELREHELRPWIVSNTSLCSMKLTLSKKTDATTTTRAGKPLPLRVTDRTEQGLKFKIARHKRRKTGK